jgi:pSer/pThr/pTyr-binding forkhead associated (FHA) protein
MTFLIVAVLVIGACAGVPFYLKRKQAQRAALPRQPTLLVYPLPLHSRQTEQFAAPASAPRMQVQQSVAPARARSTPNVATDPVAKPAQPLATDTVHFRRPSDEALQLLPGRLEVLSGLALPREIRFVRVPGERAEVILGREPSSSPQHVSLPSSTVSRQHARLDFSGGRWSLTNLSRTNPVVVNDTTLSNAQGERALVDGDRIELGDVILRFCAR